MITETLLRKECFVSVVSVLLGQSPNKERLKKLQQYLEDHFTDYEIVLVQNCPPSRSNLEADVLKSLPAIRYLQLSNVVHNDVALAAGVECAIGDYVILLSDCDPVEIIAEVVDLCRAENDVVVGVAYQSKTLAYSLIRPFVQLLLLQIGYNLPRNSTRMRCLSRSAINAVLQTGRFHHQFFMRIQKVGFNSAIYRYELISHEGSPIKTFMQGLQDMLHLFVFNSTKPLRWMSTLGLMGSFMAFIFASYSLLANVFMHRVVEGWTTIILFNSFLFMILFIMLAFFGEYLGRLLYETGDQSDYALAFEKISSVMINPSRINVLRESTGELDSAFSLSADSKKHDL